MSPICALRAYSSPALHCALKLVPQKLKRLQKQLLGCFFDVFWGRREKIGKVLNQGRYISLSDASVPGPAPKAGVASDLRNKSLSGEHLVYLFWACGLCEEPFIVLCVGAHGEK